MDALNQNLDIFAIDVVRFFIEQYISTKKKLENMKKVSPALN